MLYQCIVGELHPIKSEGKFTQPPSGQYLIKFRKKCVEVNVGSVDHPMEEVHWIEWVQLVTDKGSYRKWLNPGQAPNVQFLLGQEKPLAVYAYCNLHGLWKNELNEN